MIASRVKSLVVLQGACRLEEVAEVIAQGGLCFTNFPGLRAKKLPEVVLPLANMADLCEVKQPVVSEAPARKTGDPPILPFVAVLGCSHLMLASAERDVATLKVRCRASLSKQLLRPVPLRRPHDVRVDSFRISPEPFFQSGQRQIKV